MSTDTKQKMVKQLRYALTALWISLAATLFFHIGATSTKGMRDYYTGNTTWRVPDAGSGILIFITLVIIVIVAVCLFRLGKSSKNVPLNNERLEQLERLAKLRASGAITEDEFQREKNKIWNKE